MRIIFTFSSLLFSLCLHAQVNKHIKGKVTNQNGDPIVTAQVRDGKIGKIVLTDSVGGFRLIPISKYLVVSEMGYQTDTIPILDCKYYYEIKLKPEFMELGSVVVSSHAGNRRAIIENPIAISHVSPRQIERVESTNLIDALVKNTPGLNAVQTGPNISKPFIRGLGYNRVLTMLDGIRQEGQQWGDEHGIEMDTYNTEGADIIKGPASLMYGSDAEAGVVSIRSAVPQLSDGKIHGKFVSEYQDNNNLIGNGGNIYQRSEHWYWMASGSYRMAKNYRNQVDGRVYNTNFKESNAAFSLGHQSAAGTSSLHFTLYNDLQGIPDGSRDSLTRRFTKQIHEGDDDIINARPIVSDGELNSYQLSPLHQHIQHYRVYTDNSYRFSSGGHINASLAFQQNVRREYNHPTVPDQAGMYVRLNTINYSLRYVLPEMGNFENSIGINGMYQNNKNKNATDFPIPNYNLFDFGGFVFSKFKAGKWTATGGLRFDTRHTKGDDFYTKNDPASGFDRQVTGADTANAYLQFPALKLHYNGISASIGATYTANEHLSLKANVARGYRAPNITESASNGLDPGAHIVYIGNRDFKPEFSFQQDLGMEFTFPEISGGVSVFNNHVSNYIFLFQLTDAAGNPVQIVPGNWTYQYQQTSAHLYGFEANLDYKPFFVKGLSFHSSVATVYGKNTDKKFKDKGTDGEYLSYIPPVKWYSSIGQDILLKCAVKSVHVEMSANVNGAQNRYFGIYGTEKRTPGYTLLDASIGCTLAYAGNHTIDLSVFGGNIFDKVYQSNLSRLKYFEYYSASPNGRSGIYGMGRNIGIKAVVHF